MKFEAPTGETLAIAFRYRTYDTLDMDEGGNPSGTYQDGKMHLDNRRRVETFCLISRIHPDKTGQERFETLATGHSVRKPDDEFKKGEGRKRALTRALKALPDEIKMNKEQKRVRIWNPYFRDHNDRRCKGKQVGPGVQVVIETT